MIIASGVAGAIIYHEDLTGDYVKRIATVNIPMVFIDRDSKDKNISGVLVDDKLGATMAVDHLIKLGHKRIGYIHGNETGDDKHRFQGYKEMMEKNNLPIDEDIILCVQCYQVESNFLMLCFVPMMKWHGDVFRHYRTLELRFLKM